MRSKLVAMGGKLVAKEGSPVVMEGRRVAMRGKPVSLRGRANLTCTIFRLWTRGSPPRHRVGACTWESRH
jgi:hypothetical protein